MTTQFLRPFLQALLLAALALSPFWPATTQAQIFVGDSGVGYIDSAIPGSQLRLRFDAAYGANAPDRAEFLWAWPQPFGPGPAQNEVSTDYQSLSAQLEWAVRDDFSLFAEVPVLAVNPEVVDNSMGLSDLQAGFKWAVRRRPDDVLAFQLRAYAPSGDEDRGLGTGHVSLEPGLLYFRRLPGDMNLETEFRYWQPIGGTPRIEGSVVRYGAGVTYCGFDADDACRIPIRPVLEAVGWTALYGRVSQTTSPGGPVVVDDAAGDTIVNLKLGARMAVGASDVYLGYGRVLTGDRWYEDIVRLEWRRTF